MVSPGVKKMLTMLHYCMYWDIVRCLAWARGLWMGKFNGGSFIRKSHDRSIHIGQYNLSCCFLLLYAVVISEHIKEANIHQSTKFFCKWLSVKWWKLWKWKKKFSLKDLFWQKYWVFTISPQQPSLDIRYSQILAKGSIVC